MELEKGKGTLRDAVCPRRRTEGVKPGAAKAASPVLNRGDEATGLVKPRLVATQGECGKSYASVHVSVEQVDGRHIWRVVQCLLYFLI
jgi:hypothetical protein